METNKMEMNQNQNNDTILSQQSQPVENKEIKQVDQNNQQVSDFEIELPKDLDIDKEEFDQFKNIAKEYKLSKDAVNKIIEFEKNRIEKVMKKFEETKEEWKKETLKELGQNFQTELSYAKKALDKFGSQELYDLLDETGLGNHKAIVKLFIQIGKMLSEDKIVEGKSDIKEQRELSLEERIYPHYFKGGK